jgi:hypothetical protein
MSSFKHLASLSAVLVLSACGGGDESRVMTQLYRYTGSMQCAPEKGISPSDMAQQLAAREIPVNSFACGVDGAVVPAACGVKSGDIYVIEILKVYEEDAKKLGFGLLSNLPSYKKVDCDSGIVIPPPT